MPVDNSFAPPKTCHQMASIPSSNESYWDIPCLSCRIYSLHERHGLSIVNITLGNIGMPYAKHASLGRGTCNDFLSKAWSDTIDPANVEPKRTLLVS
jgi:hypothetical protein